MSEAFSLDHLTAVSRLYYAIGKKKKEKKMMFIQIMFV